MIERLKFWFSSKGWKALWVALHRSPRDAQARKHTFRLLFSLLFFPAYITVYAFFIRGAYRENGSDILYTVIGSVSFVILLTLVIAFFQNREQRDADRDSPVISIATKLGIYREACLLATLLERLGSEIGMEKELPEGIEVITRRVLLDRLAKFDLREGLEPELRDALLAPDGHWPQNLKNRAFGTWECLYVLRWVLRLGELQPPSDKPDYKTTDASVLFSIKQPEKLNVLPAWDIRPARDVAEQFYHRCLAERVARKEMPDATEEQVQLAIDFRESVEAKGYAPDYMVGTQTILELPSELLWLVFVRAYHRMSTLALLVEVTGGEKSASEIRSLFAGYFALKPENPSEEATVVESAS
jgi:hypothetical protein